TARQGTITPRTLNFEDEAGPSSPLRPIQVMDSEEQHNAAEVLVAISRPRGFLDQEKVATEYVLLSHPLGVCTVLEKKTVPQSTTAKKLWESLERKYKTEDAGTKKFMGSATTDIHAEGIMT
ncbi:hypothetical protein Tco_1020957, partial [Tanacetum coccineum]